MVMVRNKFGKFLRICSGTSQGDVRGKMCRGKARIHPVMVSLDAELTETNRRRSSDTSRQTITTTVFLGGPSVTHGRSRVFKLGDLTSNLGRPNSPTTITLCISM